MHKVNYMHKVSRKIVEYMEANSLNTLFVGKNVGWKDSINLGRTTRTLSLYLTIC